MLNMRLTEKNETNLTDGTAFVGQGEHPVRTVPFSIYGDRATLRVLRDVSNGISLYIRIWGESARHRKLTAMLKRGFP